MTGWSDYGQVDATADPETLVAYLEHYAAVPAIRAAKERSYALLDAGPGDRVLDVGCGPGQDVRALAALVAPGGTATGIDHSRVLVAMAERRAQELGVPGRYVVGDATALPFADAAFDACRADRVLQHIPAPERALAELRRVTRPGGRVVVTEATSAVERGGPLPAVTERLMQRSSAEHRGWVGTFLPVLLRRAGFADVVAKRDVGVVDDPVVVAELLDARRGLEELALPPGEGERWLDAAGDVAIRVQALHFVAWGEQGGSAGEPAPSNLDSAPD